MQAIKHLPLCLTALRTLLAPVVVLLAIFHPSPAALGLCLVLAFLSDVFDGILARRLGIATPTLRRLDSIADTVFYVAAAYAAWRLYPTVIQQHLAELLALGSLELARYAFDWVKFRREASYHMWSSKLWGLALFAGFFALLALGISGLPVTIAIYAGIVADVEGLAISMALRNWRTDVPTLIHALRLRALEKA
jgi:phosphatidylglycerophosphate synthase